MSESVDWLAPADRDELVAFLGRAFAKDVPDWFARYLPALYQPTGKPWARNCAIRCGGKIAANVGLFDIVWHVGGTDLRVAGIGGVAVDPDWRRHGYMRRLMDEVLRTVRDEGYCLSYLGGQRQRYGYWGWEVAGCEIRAEVHRANLLHTAGTEPAAVRLRPAGEDPAVLAQLHAIQESQPSFCRRPPDRFARHLCQWGDSSWAACDAQDRIVGYLTRNAQGTAVSELGARDPRTALQIARAAAGETGPVTFTLPCGPVAQGIVAFAERVTLCGSGNWQVFDWPLVLTALLRARHAAAPLLAGSVAIAIHGLARNLRITVDREGARCEPTADPAVFSADPRAMLQTLCGPLPPSLRTPLPPAAAILDAWCPLPLYFSRQDRV